MLTPNDDPQLLLQAYVDDELDAASALDVERRLAADPAFAAERDLILALRRRLREALPREAASGRLQQRLAAIAALPAAAPAAPVASLAVARAKPWLRPAHWRLALAASMVGAIVGALLGAGVTSLLTAPRPQSAVATEVLDDHLRAVMAPQPFDVASSDQHTVKPWFTGRLSFAPQVFDLSGEGFTLIGGRVDVVGGAPAAALVFRHGKHLVSLLSQPVVPTSARPATRTMERGFDMREWTSGGMNYWAISDVAPEELDAFEAAVQTQLAKGG